jgi:hypothetical protein
MNPTERNTMHNLPKSTIITIKIIDFVDSKFDRFRK